MVKTMSAKILKFERKDLTLKKLIISKLVAHSFAYLINETQNQYEQRLEKMSNIDLLIEYEFRLPTIKWREDWMKSFE
jgi:hypothetical protein